MWYYIQLNPCSTLAPPHSILSLYYCLLTTRNLLQDMAGVALYLASRAGAWVTGAIIPVDGGVTVNVRLIPAKL